jgi:hypothetical protein
VRRTESWEKEAVATRVGEQDSRAIAGTGKTITQTVDAHRSLKLSSSNGAGTGTRKLVIFFLACAASTMWTKVILPIRFDLCTTC